MNTTIGFTLSAIVVMSLYAGHVRAEQPDWYRQQLFEPSESQLAMEARGRVTIYDGLRDIDVQRALDEQFDRIESMMFTGTVMTDENGELLRDEVTGEVLVENDGC